MSSTHLMLLGLLCFALVSVVGCAIAADSGPTATLVDEVRRSTREYADVSAAAQAGYAPFLGCVTGPTEGAMGIHYVNEKLVGDGKLDPQHPEALIYEPHDGKLELVGVEYLVIAAQWDAGNKVPPTLMGQVFNYTGSPNRYGIPAHYSLHVWAWRPNPRGMFVDWNPKVSCAEHTHSAGR